MHKIDELKEIANQIIKLKTGERGKYFDNRLKEANRLFYRWVKQNHQYLEPSLLSDVFWMHEAIEPVWRRSGLSQPYKGKTIDCICSKCGNCIYTEEVFDWYHIRVTDGNKLIKLIKGICDDCRKIARNIRETRTQERLQKKVLEKSPVSYRQYIESKEWKRKRERVLKDNPFCVVCGAAHNKGMNVHHKHYNTLGNEDDKDLCVLCPSCHLALSKRIGDILADDCVYRNTYELFEIRKVSGQKDYYVIINNTIGASPSTLQGSSGDIKDIVNICKSLFASVGGE